MYGEYRTHLTVERIMAVMRLQQQRNHRSMPVMAMDYIRLEANGRQTFQHRPVKVREPLAVIHIAIDSVTAEVILIVDEIDGNPFKYHLFDPAILIAPANRDLQSSDMLHLSGILLRNSFVFGQNYPDIDPGRLEGFRQSADDIGQSACFDKWMGFRRGK